MMAKILITWAGHGPTAEVADRSCGRVGPGHSGSGARARDAWHYDAVIVGSDPSSSLGSRRGELSQGPGTRSRGAPDGHDGAVRIGLHVAQNVHRLAFAIGTAATVFGWEATEYPLGAQHHDGPELSPTVAERTLGCGGLRTGVTGPRTHRPTGATGSIRAVGSAARDPWCVGPADRRPRGEVEEASRSRLRRLDERRSA